MKLGCPEHIDRDCWCDLLDKEKGVVDYIHYMLDRTNTLFEYDGLPETIPQWVLEEMLQVNGFACIAEEKGELYAFAGGLGGQAYSPYYLPTFCIVANPALKLSKTFYIDKDCVILKNDTTISGLIPMFSRYAVQMVENDVSIRCAQINSRSMAVLSASTESEREGAEIYMRDLEAGKLGIIGEQTAIGDGIRLQSATKSINYLTQHIELQQYLKASWFNEIGLNSNYNMKRESVSVAEIQMNDDALLPLIDDMLNCRKRGVEKINKMFGTNITVDRAGAWKLKYEEATAKPDDKEGSGNAYGTVIE